MATAIEPISALERLIPRWREDPVSFVEDTYSCDPEGNPVVVDEPQKQILRAIAVHDRVAVRSSHGIGKTTSASWAGKWWLATRYPALVVTLAGTWGHLEQKLWPEIHTWFRVWALRDQFEPQVLGLYGRENPSAWRMEPSSSDKAENIEGWHSPNLLVIIDEAKALPSESYAAIRGALTQVSARGMRPKVLVLSTPPLQDAGWYADLFSRKSEGWKLIHVSAEDSGRVSSAYIEEMERDFGRESAVFQSKVLGNIPTVGSGAVIEVPWIEAAQAREERPNNKGVVLTCDVAREGEDLTVIGKIQNWKWTIPWLEETNRPAWRATNDLMECAGLCVQAAHQFDARMLVIDDTGLGGGVTDRLHELKREGVFPATCSIVGHKFGEKPIVRPERFAKLKDEMWWTLRDHLREGKLALPTEEELAALQLPRGSDLRSQLASPLYEEDSLSRIRVLDKRDSTDRREKMKVLPTKSPDLAHALMLGVREYASLSEAPEHPKNTAEEELQRRHAAIQARKRRFSEEEGGMGAPGW